MIKLAIHFLLEAVLSCFDAAETIFQLVQPRGVDARTRIGWHELNRLRRFGFGRTGGLGAWLDIGTRRLLGLHCKKAFLKEDLMSHPVHFDGELLDVGLFVEGKNPSHNSSNPESAGWDRCRWLAM